MSSRDRDYVAALEKGLAVIECFDSTQPSLTLSKVAQKTGLTRAAARRHLLTLTALGYTSFDGKRFQLTPRILKLGYTYFSTTPLPRLAQPILEAIGEQVDQVASLAVLEGADVVFLARSAPRRIMSGVVAVGVRVLAISAGTGRLLLAQKPDAAIREMLRKIGPIAQLSPMTKTSPAEIMKEIEQARRQGYSINDQEIEIGLRSISVPVKNSAGIVVAAISVSMPPSRMTPERMVTEVLPILRHGADTLRAML
jgi:IclR family pca regulon transcriptional regulator